MKGWLVIEVSSVTVVTLKFESAGTQAGRGETDGEERGVEGGRNT